MALPLPHDDYIGAVDVLLTGLGHEPAQWWTETPDGEQLDGIIFFRRGAGDPELWAGGVYLGWDQRSGWALCDTGTRTLFPLDLGIYPAPEAVATRTSERLQGRDDSDVNVRWDGVGALVEAVHAWEQEGQG